MIPLQYSDIIETLKETIKDLDIVKKYNDNVNQINHFSVMTYGRQPPNSQNFIGVGFIADKAKRKDDTFDDEERDYIFQVRVSFKRLGSDSGTKIEKLNSLFSLLLKNSFRLSDKMICKIHERDQHGEIVYDEHDQPIINGTVDLRHIITISEIIPIFGSPSGDGFSMNIKFDIDEEEIKEKVCYSITQQIEEVLLYGERENYRRETNQLQEEALKSEEEKE